MVSTAAGGQRAQMLAFRAPPSILPPMDMPPRCPLNTSMMGSRSGRLSTAVLLTGLKASIADTTEGPCNADVTTHAAAQLTQKTCMEGKRAGTVEQSHRGL